MKKFFIVALAAMSMTFVSCGKKSVEDQAKAYAEQMIQMEESGDNSKYEALAKEIDEWGKSLSEEEKAKAEKVFEAAMMEYANKKLGIDAETLKEAAEDTAEEATEAVEEAAEAVEEAAEAVEEAVEE